MDAPARLFLLGVGMAVLFSGDLMAQAPALPAGTTSVDGPAANTPDKTSSASGMLAQAEDCIARGAMQQALPLLNGVLALTPNDARALYDRGHVEEALQKFSGAAADFQRAIVLDPKQYESYVALGRLDAQQGKMAEARTQLEAAATLAPVGAHPEETKANGLRLLARVDEQLHDPTAASDALLQALKMTPEQPEDTLLAARLAEEQGDLSGAATEYRKAISALQGEQTPTIDAICGLARVLTREGRPEEAETLLNQALTQHPNDPALLAQLVPVLVKEGKTSGAIAALESLHQAGPGQAAVTRMLADLYTQSGMAAKADPLYQQLLAQGRPDAGLLTARGENLVLQQRYAEAVAVLQKAVALQPGLPDTWSDLAFAASEDKQYALVLQALDHRADYKPEVPATLFLRATALDHLHQTKQAIAYYKQFVLAAGDKFPDEVWQAQHRLTALSK